MRVGLLRGNWVLCSVSLQLCSRFFSSRLYLQLPHMPHISECLMKRSLKPTDLRDMTIGQLQVIVNDLHSQIESKCEQCVRWGEGAGWCHCLCSAIHWVHPLHFRREEENHKALVSLFNSEIFKDFESFFKIQEGCRSFLCLLNTQLLTVCMYLTHSICL